MSVRVDAETLRKIPIFADCDTVHLQLLAFSAEREEFGAGVPILKQGDKAKSAYLVTSGAIDIRRRHGLEFHQAAIAGPGSMIGEIAMIGRGHYAITATSLSPVTTARIDHTLFMRVATEYPEFGENVYTALARRVDAAKVDLNEVRNRLLRAKSFSDI